MFCLTLAMTYALVLLYVALMGEDSRGKRHVHVGERIARGL